MNHKLIVNSNAFKAMLKGYKTVELRKSKKKYEVGDYIHFYDNNSYDSLCVVIDKVEEYSSINKALNSVPIELWSFPPIEECSMVIQNEFDSKLDHLNICAIYFHKIKVSIIMPAFNSMLYLKETLNTIVCQVYKDYELIFLDDCSTDKTIDILHTYMKVLPIKLVKYKNHKGSAFLRNEGLKLARGMYIVFWDSDDLFEADYLANLVETIERTDTDIVIAEYDSFNSDEGYKKYPYPAYATDFVQYSITNTFTWIDLPMNLNHWTNVPWNKMFKREFLLKIKASFQDLPSSNDVYFSHYTMCLGKIRHINSCKAMVHYRTARKGSISNNRDYYSVILSSIAI